MHRSALLVIALACAACAREPEAVFHLRSGAQVSYSCTEQVDPTTDPFAPVAALEYAEHIATDSRPDRTRLVQTVAQADSTKDVTTLFEAVRAYLCEHGQPPRRPARFPEPGSRAPDFAVIHRDGAKSDTLRGSELEGRPFLLAFWGAWCTPCREEFPYLRELVHALGEHGIPVVLVAFNEPEGVSSRWMREQGETQLRVYNDPGGRTAKDYLVNGIPWTYAVNAAGEVVAVLGRLDRVGQDSILDLLEPERSP